MGRIILFSLRNKLIILLISVAILVFGLYSLTQISIGAVPDITNNQVQIITTSKDLGTEDVEKYLTYPVELEMANLPGVKEIRSISKFGLSVVTVVFEDHFGTYLPRQLIAEKIKSAEEQIPKNFGTPFMGPVTTGLGEIYQYTIEVDQAYKEHYSLMDIRTIQDWIVKRQLSGIPGVVEVNTWGGELKQYEVALIPNRLKSSKVSVNQVYKTLTENNGVVGGSYIEKNGKSYFIRAQGLLLDLNDIENLIVRSDAHGVLRIKDIAQVQFGKANRFGAITGNGEGEKVLGQVMMLKGANSNQVIEAVKKRVDEIQTTLPEGIRINPFLERSELISKTSSTLAENLILGCLVVIFVVVLLLGNWRSGLVVASVIPLCLLFAIGLMYVFDVDANLMSLGAIDFGIIIDGAVIIVEYVSFTLNRNAQHLLALTKKDRLLEINELTATATSGMMHSAVFGQLIILIVFIPVLSLVGIEGKMFKPMAEVFCFALIGAIFLCFTYVPVMSALVIKPQLVQNNISSRMLSALQGIYRKTLVWSLNRYKLVLAGAFCILLFSAWIFSRMGGEFIPTLDEGDFVIQPVLKSGTSLSETVEITTKIESILLEFPEVEQVVSRIGAAEVPTDPMSLEESDVIIKLKPRKFWETAKTKDALADAFKLALMRIPGLEYEFTQPIEMRFNELITGVKSDLAIKVFGEDLNILYEKALEIQNAISGIEGAEDITVEKIAGLPQMEVQYDKNRMAQYGLNVSDLNDIVSVGFAGKLAGRIFEGEKQFDLVLRFKEEYRQDIDALRNTPVILPNGESLPLREFASIEFRRSPAKISRDNTKRRVVVSVNVRNRDLESVVGDVQSILSNQIELPIGYSIELGGQFENLQTAKQRLAFAVPLALLLILILLYFAFNSIKQALIIYSTIPLAAVGGIALLSLRSMPFSISAGIGFIALFGIAVLNGIVLIEEFNKLNKEGIGSLSDRILQGTQNRLRPVLLTASAAALGFLPMALSTSAGAEVQRPLATVVVGGLLSSTFLTLIVLPVLYYLLNTKRWKASKSRIGAILLAFILFPEVSNAQTTKAVNLTEAMEMGLRNNRQLLAGRGQILQSKERENEAVDIDKTQIFYGYDENNIAANGLPLNVWGLRQSIAFPTVYGSRSKIFENQTDLVESQYKLGGWRVQKEISKAYYTVLYWEEILQRLNHLDSLYHFLEKYAEKQYQVGETTYLEKLMTTAKSGEINRELKAAGLEFKQSLNNLNLWVQSDTVVFPIDKNLDLVVVLSQEVALNPMVEYHMKSVELAKTLESLERNRFWPDLEFAVFQGSNNGLNQRNYSGVEAGIAIPLWFGAQKSRLDAARIETDIQINLADNYTIRRNMNYQKWLSELEKEKEEIDYFKETGKQLADELLKQASRSLEAGEIDFLQYVQIVENSKSIEMRYLNSLLMYNFSALELNYLTE